MTRDEEGIAIDSVSEEAAEVTVEPTASEDREASDEPRFERRWSKRPRSKSVEVEVGDGDLAAELQKEKGRADDLYDRLQRSMADLSNYRKRAESDREEMSKFATMVLVAELLPVLDNFDRALSAIPRELQHFTWLQGIMLIERQLRAILEHQGLEPIDAVGKGFDPSLHEALAEEETADAEPGTIIGELQTGYMMHGRVLRPTMAKLAKRPQGGGTAEPAEPESDTTSEEAGGGAQEPEAQSGV